jgi:hypothetical protein
MGTRRSGMHPRADISCCRWSKGYNHLKQARVAVKKLRSFQADRAYGSRTHRLALEQPASGARLPDARTAHGSNLGKSCGVVERTIAWPHQFRRLRVR